MYMKPFMFVFPHRLRKHHGWTNDGVGSGRGQEANQKESPEFRSGHLFLGRTPPKVWMIAVQKCYIFDLSQSMCSKCFL